MRLDVDLDALRCGFSCWAGVLGTLCSGVLLQRRGLVRDIAMGGEWEGDIAGGVVTFGDHIN